MYDRFIAAISGYLCVGLWIDSGQLCYILFSICRWSPTYFQYVYVPRAADLAVPLVSAAGHFFLPRSAERFFRLSVYRVARTDSWISVRKNCMRLCAEVLDVYLPGLKGRINDWVRKPGRWPEKIFGLLENDGECWNEMLWATFVSLAHSSLFSKLIHLLAPASDQT